MPLTIDEIKTKQIELESKLVLIGDIIFQLTVRQSTIKTACESISKNLIAALENERR